MKLEFSQQIFEKYSNIKFHENPSSGSQFVRCGPKDRQADMTKLIVACRNFANAPKNCSLSQAQWRRSLYAACGKNSPDTRCLKCCLQCQVTFAPFCIKVETALVQDTFKIDTCLLDNKCILVDIEYGACRTKWPCSILRYVITVSAPIWKNWGKHESTLGRIARLRFEIRRQDLPNTQHSTATYNTGFMVTEVEIHEFITLKLGIYYWLWFDDLRCNGPKFDKAAIRGNGVTCRSAISAKHIIPSYLVSQCIVAKTKKYYKIKLGMKTWITSKALS